MKINNTWLNILFSACTTLAWHHANAETSLGDSLAASATAAAPTVPSDPDNGFKNGIFELLCDGIPGVVATGRYFFGSVYFPVSAVSSHDACYVNVTTSEHLSVDPANYYALGTKTYWASIKGRVYVQDGALRTRLLLYKSHAAPFNAARGTPVDLPQPATSDQGGLIASIEPQGDCRVFSANRLRCKLSMPQSCFVPMREAQGSYEPATWLFCVRDIATRVYKIFLPDSIEGIAPPPESEDQRKARETVERLQMAAFRWGQAEEAARPAVIDEMIDEARSLTARSPEVIGRVHDEALVYGVEKVLLPTLLELKARSSADE